MDIDKIKASLLSDDNELELYIDQILDLTEDISDDMLDADPELYELTQEFQSLVNGLQHVPNGEDVSYNDELTSVLNKIVNKLIINTTGPEFTDYVDDIKSKFNTVIDEYVDKKALIELQTKLGKLSTVGDEDVDDLIKDIKSLLQVNTPSFDTSHKQMILDLVNGIDSGVTEDPNYSVAIQEIKTKLKLAIDTVPENLTDQFINSFKLEDKGLASDSANPLSTNVGDGIVDDYDNINNILASMKSDITKQLNDRINEIRNSKVSDDEIKARIIELTTDYKTILSEDDPLIKSMKSYRVIENDGEDTNTVLNSMEEYLTHSLDEKIAKLSEDMKLMKNVSEDIMSKESKISSILDINDAVDYLMGIYKTTLSSDNPLWSKLKNAINPDSPYDLRLNNVNKIMDEISAMNADTKAVLEKNKTKILAQVLNNENNSEMYQLQLDKINQQIQHLSYDITTILPSTNESVKKLKELVNLDYEVYDPKISNVIDEVVSPYHASITKIYEEMKTVTAEITKYKAGDPDTNIDDLTEYLIQLNETVNLLSGDHVKMSEYRDSLIVDLKDSFKPVSNSVGSDSDKAVSDMMIALRTEVTKRTDVLKKKLASLTMTRSTNVNTDEEIKDIQSQIDMLVGELKTVLSDNDDIVKELKDLKNRVHDPLGASSIVEIYNMLIKEGFLSSSDISDTFLNRGGIINMLKDASLKFIGDKFNLPTGAISKGLAMFKLLYPNHKNPKAIATGAIKSATNSILFPSGDHRDMIDRVNSMFHGYLGQYDLQFAINTGIDWMMKEKTDGVNVANALHDLTLLKATSSMHGTGGYLYNALSDVPNVDYNVISGDYRTAMIRAFRYNDNTKGDKINLQGISEKDTGIKGSEHLFDFDMVRSYKDIKGEFADYLSDLITGTITLATGKKRNTPVNFIKTIDADKNVDTEVYDLNTVLKEFMEAKYKSSTHATGDELDKPKRSVTELVSEIEKDLGISLDLKYARSRAIHTFNRYNSSNAILSQRSGRSYIFVTKPDLNLSDKNILYSPTLQVLVGKAPWIRQYLNSSNKEDESGTDVKHTLHNPFIPLLSNYAKSSSMPDIEVSMRETFMDRHGTTQDLPGRIEGSKRSVALSITFGDNRYKDVRTLIQTWVEYIAALEDGEITPLDKYRKMGMLDYLSSVYIVNTAEDGETITGISRWTGVSPTSIPSSTGSFKKIQTHEDVNMDMDIKWSNVAFDPFDDSLILDFNDQTESAVADIIGGGKNPFSEILSLKANGASDTDLDEATLSIMQLIDIRKTVNQNTNDGKIPYIVRSDNTVDELHPRMFKLKFI